MKLVTMIHNKTVRNMDGAKTIHFCVSIAEFFQFHAGRKWRRRLKKKRGVGGQHCCID